MIVLPNRAAEILAAFGADPSRWPDAERADCLALVDRLPSLGYEHRMEAALDAGLIAWAREPLVVHDGDAQRAVTRALAALPVPVRVKPLAWMGGALAASLAVGLAFVTFRPTTPAQVAAPIQITQAQADSAQFRAVFTPTPDEEDVLL